MVRSTTTTGAKQYVALEMDMGSDIPTRPSPPPTPHGVERRVAEKITRTDEGMNMRNCKIITVIWVILIGVILFAAQARPSVKQSGAGELHWSQNVLRMTGLASDLLQEAVAKKNKAFKKCNVMASGAVGDGNTLDTKAFIKAIRLCVGSGVVVVPSGTYALEYLHLKSDTSILLQAGAVLQAGPTDDPPPSAITYPFAPFVTVNNASNVVIQGKGSIRGQGLHWVARPPGALDASWAERLHDSPLVQVLGSREVIIRGVTLEDSTRNTLLIKESHVVVAEKIQMTDTVRDVQHIGVLVEASKTVEMSVSTISTNGGVAFGVRSSSAAPCKAIVLEKTTVAGGASVGLLPSLSGTKPVTEVVFKDLVLDGRGTDAQGNTRPRHSYGGLMVRARAPPYTGVSTSSLPAELPIIEKVLFTAIKGYNLTFGIDLLVETPLDHISGGAEVFGNGNIDEDDEEALAVSMGKKVQLSTIEFSDVSFDNLLEYQVRTNAPASATISGFHLQNVAFSNANRDGWDCHAAIHGTATNIQPPIPAECTLLPTEAGTPTTTKDAASGNR